MNRSATAAATALVMLAVVPASLLLSPAAALSSSPDLCALVNGTLGKSGGSTCFSNGR